MNSSDDMPVVPASLATEATPNISTKDPVESVSPLSNTSIASGGPLNPVSSGGPLNLEQIRRMREMQAAAAAKIAAAPKNNDDKSNDEKNNPERKDPEPEKNRDAMVAVATPTHEKAYVSDESVGEPPRSSGSRDKFKRRNGKKSGDDDSFTAPPEQVLPKVARPSIRQPLSADLEQELESALMDADLNGLMIGAPSLNVGRNIDEGSRHQGRIIKVHQDCVFVSLGGPDQGVIPLLQFTDLPKADDVVDCLVRTFNSEDGLYELALPGEATSVDDWSDIQEGILVEATVESCNTGGLECKIGGIRGFIPMRQISEFRVEDTSGYIGQRLMCIVLEANPNRGNLVLSHRAVLEREKQEKRAERLANLEIGQATEGIVRKIMDFGAFIDIGGLDGLLHISQLSYERVKHPSEILKEGDKIQVRVDKIDPETGKIGLSYRSLQEHPWANIEAQFPIGNMVKGTVSRIANFGAFVKLATGVEGLIHVSELAHRRINNVASVVQEGQEIEVKILTVERENQRIGLSLKAALPVPEVETPSATKEAEPDEPPRAPIIKHRGPLKGGAGSNPAGGERFGLKW